MIAITSLLVATLSAAAPAETDLAAAEVIIRYEAALPDHALESSPFCIEVTNVDVGKEISDRLGDARLKIVPMDKRCPWMKLFGSVHAFNGQWVVPYGSYGYCEDRTGGCINAGKAMSAILEKDGAKWRVVRLVGGVNF
jgi:hypothetical protein